uniref:Uncharacterized protein n=1 Tax=Ciona intestinalis TaxID=7719 RepID=F6PJ07_CIOIN
GHKHSRGLSTNHSLPPCLQRRGGQPGSDDVIIDDIIARGGFPDRGCTKRILWCIRAEETPLVWCNLVNFLSLFVLYQSAFVVPLSL